MGGGAFNLLKACRRRPESAKQAEIRLSILLKILWIAGFRGTKSLAKTGKDMRGLYFGNSAGYG
jgi:hypothetical protein